MYDNGILNPWFIDYELCGSPPDENKLGFIENRENYSENMKYVDDRVFHCIENLLSKKGFQPVSLGNMLEAFKFIHDGCKSNNILLNILE